MKILYVNLDRELIGAPDFLRAERYEVCEVTSLRDALNLIGAHSFDAVLIDDTGHAKTVDFMMDVRRVRPYLPVFVVSAWGPDLVSALHCLATSAQAAAV